MSRVLARLPLIALIPSSLVLGQNPASRLGDSRVMVERTPQAAMVVNQQVFQSVKVSAETIEAGKPQSVTVEAVLAKRPGVPVVLHLRRIQPDGSQQDLGAMKGDGIAFTGAAVFNEPGPGRIQLKVVLNTSPGPAVAMMARTAEYPSQPLFISVQQPQVVASSVRIVNVDPRSVVAGKPSTLLVGAAASPGRASVTIGRFGPDR